MKKIIAVILVVCMAASLCACNSTSNLKGLTSDLKDSVQNLTPEAKTFEFDGVSIDLNTEFISMDFLAEDFAFVVGDGDITVMGFYLSSEEFGSENTENDFDVKTIAAFYRGATAANGSPTELSEHNGIPYFEYNDTADGVEQTNLFTFYKTSGDFLVIIFAFDSASAETLRPTALGYAETVKCE